MFPDQPAETIEQEIIAAELHMAVRAAFGELPERCRQLLSMLIGDPPLSYAQISDALSIRIGASARNGRAAWTGCAVPPSWPSSATRCRATRRLW